MPATNTLIPLLLVPPFCAIFVIIGGGLFLTGIKGIVQGDIAKRWPTSEAVLRDVNVEVSSRPDSPGSTVTIKYEFVVNGRLYTGNTIHPSMGDLYRENNQRNLLDKLAVGTKVKVHYNPNSPNINTLVVGFYSGSLALPVVGLVLMAFGLGLLFIVMTSIFGNWNYSEGIEVL